MTPDTLQAAVRAAEEFLRRAKTVPTETITSRGGKPWRVVTGGKQSAAAKRASLDLTRALADMRRVGG